MGDPQGPKSPSIPQWQRQEASDTPSGSQTETSEKPKPEVHQNHHQPPPSRATLLEQASKFLEDEDIRDSPTERKISFLEAKGLTNEEIHKLLGVSRNPDPIPAKTETFESKSSPPLSHQESSASSPPVSSPSQPRDIPPIITYPEFLLHSQKPPPLITARRLLNTLYFASGAATTIYGTSKYVVAPMLETLSYSRHSLFETASENLDTLNEMLEGNVSVVPDSATHARSYKDGPDDTSETSSITSDPTELFHRDIATQTSLPQSPMSSDSSSPPEPTPKSELASQTTRLQIIHSHLSEFLSTANTLIASDEGVKDNISELQTYLDGLAYGSSTYVNGYAGIGGGTSREKDDEIAKVKAEIRGVKGVLLSARTFPGGVGRGKVGA